MKRIVAWALALMLVGFAALAEGEAFVFRDGVTWGMTPDEVLAAEGNPEHEVEEDGSAVALIEIDDVPVAGTKGELNYVFLEDTLVMAGYVIDEDDLSIDQMAEAVGSKYGDPTGSDPSVMSELLGLLYGFQGWTPNVDSRYMEWMLENGVLIALTDDFGDIQLAYLDVSGIRAAAAQSSVGEPAPQVVLSSDGL